MINCKTFILVEKPHDLAGWGGGGQYVPTRLEFTTCSIHLTWQLRGRNSLLWCLLSQSGPNWMSRPYKDMSRTQLLSYTGLRFVVRLQKILLERNRSKTLLRMLMFCFHCGRDAQKNNHPLSCIMWHKYIPWTYACPLTAWQFDFSILLISAVLLSSTSHDSLFPSITRWEVYES